MKYLYIAQIRPGSLNNCFGCSIVNIIEYLFLGPLPGIPLIKTDKETQGECQYFSDPVSAVIIMIVVVE